MSAMGALLEFECRPAVGGYDVVTFDQLRGKKPPRGAAYSAIVLSPDASDDERFMGNRWGRHLLIGDHDPRDGTPTPRVIGMLRPRSERIRRFDLFQSGPSTFLEFARTPLTPEGVKAFVDVYGPLYARRAEEYCITDFFGHYIGVWASEIREMRKAVELWDELKTTGDFSKLIRVLERRSDLRAQRDREFGTETSILLKKDRSGAARLCIRPAHLRDALWIQLALAIDGNLNLRACVECRNWFTLEAGSGRSDKVYCSNARRMRAYRKRRGS